MLKPFFTRGPKGLPFGNNYMPCFAGSGPLTKIFSASTLSDVLSTMLLEADAHRLPAFSTGFT